MRCIFWRVEQAHLGPILENVSTHVKLELAYDIMVCTVWITYNIHKEDLPVVTTRWARSNSPIIMVQLQCQSLPNSSDHVYTCLPMCWRLSMYVLNDVRRENFLKFLLFQPSCVALHSGLKKTNAAWSKCCQKQFFYLDLIWGCENRNLMEQHSQSITAAIKIVIAHTWKIYFKKITCESLHTHCNHYVGRNSTTLKKWQASRYIVYAIHHYCINFSVFLMDV